MKKKRGIALLITALMFVLCVTGCGTQKIETTKKETTEENEDVCFGHIIKSVKECREGEDEIMKYYSSHEFFEEGKKEGREES